MGGPGGASSQLPFAVAEEQVCCDGAHTPEGMRSGCRGFRGMQVGTQMFKWMRARTPEATEAGDRRAQGRGPHRLCTRGTHRTLCTCDPPGAGHGFCAQSWGKPLLQEDGRALNELESPKNIFPNKQNGGR